MIAITEKAAQKALALMQEEGKDNYFIKVSVQSGGCSGLNYKLNFEQNTAEGDQIFETHGVKIAVEKLSFLYLVGTTLDFEGGLNGKGFVFVNPNAQRTCGCGESFSL
jgi:iron-sulfur cluster assembly protein